MNSITSTVPGTHTRPRSLRPRSTSITCSARSLGSSSSSVSSSASSAGSAPRGLEPAIGCVTATLSVTVTRASGEEPTMSKPRPRASSQPQQVHVRARVRQPQDPVDVEGVGGGVDLEALTDHDLEGLAGLDLLHGRGHRRLVLRRTCAGGAPEARGRAGQRPPRTAAGSGQQPGHLLDPGGGVGVRLVHPFVGVVVVDGVGHQPHLAAVMIDDHQVRRQHEGQFGNVEVVRVAIGQPFHPADRVVAQITDQPRGEGRQILVPRRVQQPERVPNGLQRIATGRQELGPPAGPGGLAVHLGQHCGGPDADEGVARPHTLLRRLQQVAAGTVARQLLVEPDRGLPVDQEPPIQRDDPTLAARPAGTPPGSG